MCSDDLRERWSGTANFYSSSFGFDASQLLLDPNAYGVLVSEVVVTPIASDPVDIIPFSPVGIDIVNGVGFSPQIQDFVTNGSISIPDNFGFPADPTPSVVATPAGVNMDELNAIMLFQSNVLASYSAGDGNEWGVIVYKDVNGNLHASNNFTAGQPNNLNGARAAVPGNATIVAWQHTHPYTSGTDQRMPSPLSQGPNSDAAFVQGLINLGRADPHMVTYINTDINGPINSPGGLETHAYDVNNLSNGSLGSLLDPQ